MEMVMEQIMNNYCSALVLFSLTMLKYTLSGPSWLSLLNQREAWGIIVENVNLPLNYLPDK